jgi:hypothetical protein
LWDVATGGVYYPTQIVSHLGGAAIALAGVRVLGMPRGVWWRALVAALALYTISRYATPPAANVNLAFAVWPGFDRYIHSHIVYVVGVHAVCGAYFFVAERLLRRALVR